MVQTRPALAHMRTQLIVEISRACASTPGAISLCFGESDLPTPTVVREAAEEAMHSGATLYADRRGIAALRLAIQDYHRHTHGVHVELDRITATSSGMSSIMVALQSVIDAGDNVVVVSPVWPNVIIAIESMGAEARFIRLELGSEGWSLDLDRVEAACDKRTRAIFIATPGNPTGWTMSTHEQRELMELARRHRTWVIADEVYNRLVYDGSIATPSFLEVAEADDSLFVVQSFSKTWAMTGWRLGWLVHPSEIAHQVGNLSAINSTGSATFVQHAGVAAIRSGEPFVHQMRERCLRGRELVATAFATNERIQLVDAPASFYSFFRIEGVDDDLDYARALVTRGLVGIAPGSAFGPGNEGFFRICFAQDPERLACALERIVSCV